MHNGLQQPFIYRFAAGRTASTASSPPCRPIARARGTHCKCTKLVSCLHVPLYIFKYWSTPVCHRLLTVLSDQAPLSRPQYSKGCCLRALPRIRHTKHAHQAGPCVPQGLLILQFQGSKRPYWDVPAKQARVYAQGNAPCSVVMKSIHNCK